MFGKEKRALRSKDTANLAQRRLRVRYRAEHEAEDGAIEALVVEGQCLSRRLDKCNRCGCLFGALLGTLQHMGVRLDSDDLDLGRVEREVHARTGAQLEHMTGGTWDELAPDLLQGSHDRIDQRSDDGVSFGS